MLRSWTDRVRIYLHPEQVVLVRQTGLVKRRIIAMRVIPVDVAGEFAWSGVLKVLEAALKQPEWQGARTAMILSGHFARYRIVPWNNSLTEEERIVLLRHQFAGVYGEPVKDWQVTIADGGYGKPGMACAVDGRVMLSIQNACTAASIRLTSIRPYLVTAFNRWRHKLDSQGAWFVLAEQSHLSIAFIRHGEWQTMRSHCSTSNRAFDLEQLLVREALQLGVEATAFTVYFFSAESDSKPDLPECFKVQMLDLTIIPGGSSQNGSRIAAVLCA